ncbi:MAG: hypothetical protein JNL62_21105 [Bryobacterales bacterium]|nr:hypothetical protein [Bryobacterales bacterium]
MRILLTGGSGFLGTSLQRHWRLRGHEVCDSGRCRLGEALPSSLLEGCEAMVHLAHDFGRDATARNREGTMEWFEAAHRTGVRRQLFASSFSARADSPSRYGETKYAIERCILERGAMVVRPGLVAGNGGMFAQMVRRLRRFSIVPLVKPDTRSVAVVSLEDFLAAMTKLIEEHDSGAWNLFAPSLLTGREFTQIVWSGLGKSGVIIGVPPALAMVCLRVAGATLALDSVKGQLANSAPLHRSDLERLLTRPADAAAAVESAAREVSA